MDNDITKILTVVLGLAIILLVIFVIIFIIVQIKVHKKNKIKNAKLNEGSKNYINGGTFESPQHGGIYCCSGSAGHTEINGGTFKNIGGSVNGWNTAYSFGAAYFGCANNTKAAWHVDVKNAKFVNEWGDHGIVQKSNNGYIPPTINLYNTYISGKGDDINIQNNDSVKSYNAYVNLYAGTVLEHNRIRDYYADGHNGESFVKDYR